MAEIKNTFLKGKMNKDLDPRIIPNGEYRDARNLAISRSENSTVGEFENILGNSLISTIPDSADIIGYLIDNNSNVAYFMATTWDPLVENPPLAIDARAPFSAKCYIVKVDLSSSNPDVILVQGSFLNFNKNFSITGINLVEDLLFWTDNLNQPRKINVRLAEQSSGHYTNEDQISVAKYAPYEPILVLDRVQVTIVGGVTESNTIVVSNANNAYDNIKVGDIVTDKNKITGQQITELVTVIGKPVTPSNALTLSNPITITNGSNVDFSRSTMTNSSDFEMSNYSSGKIKVIQNTGLNSEYSISLTDSGITTNERPFIYEGKNGIPKIGDLVVGDGVSSDTRISSVSVINQYKDPSPANPDTFSMYQKITFTLNKTTTLSVGDDISISVNPDYNAAWAGDKNLLEDKFIRFSYRFKFEDEEYSLMAPFSQPMFIPKQYSQFGCSSSSDKEDMDNAYKSTILTWFENNINNILLKIPMPGNNVESVAAGFKITHVDVLYKESDALAVKVLDTVKIVSQQFSSISFKDAVNSLADAGNEVLSNTKYFLDHEYSSTKPYKTLPNNQITRVSDKVPIKALAQEIIGNRVVYGNYVDRHTSPESIAFSAFATNKSTNFDNYTQFTNHQLKQNRTYQVGFVLSDRYGRQSDVILSQYDNDPLRAGSTVFHPYNHNNTQQQSPILDWLGNALNVTLYEEISGSDGPGIYSATNPLGWYSYRVVVKQTEQEYYNVYLPGFVNGYPVLGTTKSERNTSFFTTILGDNVNKIPRDLSEVGPNDRDFTSSENLSIRVNNPRINNKTIASPVYQKNEAWNTQYYPNGVEQEIIQIGTVRDLEIQAIPFKPGVNSGEYGESAILQTYNYIDNNPSNAVESINEIPEPTGAIPWGTTGPDATFYNGESNPFIIKGNQSENKNNPIGAYVTTLSVNSNPVPEAVLSMAPFLSVAETKPVESLLDIYWETSLSGKLSDLNSLVNVQYSGLIGSNFEAANFPESVTSSDVIGFGFNFIKGDSQLAQASYVTATINSIVDGDGTAVPTNTFTLSKNITETAFEIKPNDEFFYSENILNNPTEGVYTITVDTTFNGENDTIVLQDMSLTNVAPSIDSFSQPTGITTAQNQTIISLTGKNGSADPAVNTTELNWEIDSVSPSIEASNFSIGSSTGVLTNGQALTDNTSYSIGVKVTDANGNGLTSSIAYINFTIGTNTTGAVPLNICSGRNLSASVPGCSQNIEYRFLASNTATGSSGDYPAHFNPNTPYDPPNIVYNVKAEGDNSTTGALTQGEMYITVSMRNPSNATLQSSLFVDYLIQHRSDSNNNWGDANDLLTNSTVGGINEYVRIEIDSTNGTDPVSTTYHFSQAGEYRVISTKVEGEDCPTTNPVVFYVDFGDAINGQDENSSCYAGEFGGLV